MGVYYKMKKKKIKSKPKKTKDFLIVRAETCQHDGSTRTISIEFNNKKNASDFIRDLIKDSRNILRLEIFL